MLGLTIKDPETMGYTFYIYKCSVKDFKCKVSLYSSPLHCIVLTMHVLLFQNLEIQTHYEKCYFEYAMTMAEGNSDQPSNLICTVSACI